MIYLRKWPQIMAFGKGNYIYKGRVELKVTLTLVCETTAMAYSEVQRRKLQEEEFTLLCQAQEVKKTFNYAPGGQVAGHSTCTVWT